jgi:hypothetical protein
MRELGKIGKQFCFGHTSGKMPQHFTDCETRTPHTGFVEANSWGDPDTFK